MDLWLIQHKRNGYVHCVFSKLKAARLWIDMYEKSVNRYGSDCEYTIIHRFLFDHPHDIK